MQAIGDLVYRLGLFYVFILLGFLIARALGEQSTRFNKIITNVLIYILLPILIFHTILNASIESLGEIPVIVFVTLIMHLLGFGILFGLLRNRPIPEEKKGSMLMCVTFNNGIFLPIPLLLIFVGASAVPIVAFFVITQMLLFSVLGSSMGAMYNPENVNLQETVKKVVLFPPFIVGITSVVLLLVGLTIPVELDPLLSVNGTVTTYLSLFVVGLGLNLQISSAELRSTLQVFSVRQVIVPIVIGLFLFIIPLSPLTKDVLLLEAMMPPAVFTVIFASAFELDVKSAATIVTVGTILLLPVVPFIPLLLGLV